MRKFKLALTFCILAELHSTNLPELHSTNLHESVSGLRNLRPTAFLSKCVCNVSTYNVPSSADSISTTSSLYWVPT